MSIILLLPLVCKIMIILYSTKPIISYFFTLNEYHTIGLLILLALDFICSLVALKIEFKTKYNTLSSELKNIEPKNEAEVKFMKHRTDLIYNDSLRNSLASSYKVVILLLILCLMTSLFQK